MTDPVTCTYKSFPECELGIDIYSPLVAARPTPFVIWIHGGALIFGSRKMLPTNQLERYLARGLGVASIDYRLAPETPLESLVGDVLQAVAWLCEEAPARFQWDATRVGLVGHSAGGYLALMAASRRLPRVQAVISFYGYGDIAADWYGKPSPFYCQQPMVSEAEALAVVGSTELVQGGDERKKFYLNCRQQGVWASRVAGRSPVAEPDYFSPFCPVRLVQADYPPTMLLHGDRDNDVPVEQSIQMARALEAAGAECELRLLPGEDHAFDLDLNREPARQAFEAALDFLDGHLKT
jgi:acetyl esterase/lipase